MAAQEYYDSFKEPVNTPPLPKPSHAHQPSASSGYSSTPTHSYSNGGGAPVSYPDPPYPTTPEPMPRRRTPPYPTEPRSRQYLAPPGGPPPNIGSSYHSSETTRRSRTGPRPSDPYAYPAHAPLAHQRSTSEPPENRRVSASSPGGRHRHRPHRNSRDDLSGYDYYDDSDRSPSHSHSQDRSRSSHRQLDEHRRAAERARSNMNTFLGAGGGALVGDAIFPGLGTLGGLLIGGWSGHEYSKRRSKSDGKYDDSKPQRGKGRKGSNGDRVTVRKEWD